MGIRINQNGIYIDDELSIPAGIDKDAAIATLQTSHSFNSKYKDNWLKGFLGNGLSGEFFELVKEGDVYTGIRIKKPGLYRAYVFQRLRIDGYDNYSNYKVADSWNWYGHLGLNGDREALFNKAISMMHDHAINQYIGYTAIFVGNLVNGDIITAGPCEEDMGYYSNDYNNHTGTLILERLGSSR